MYLVCFPQCEDSKVPYLIVALKRCLEASLQQAPKEIKLKRYMVQGYIGLFLEEEAASWFREVMRKFTSEARRQGGSPAPPPRLVTGDA